MRKFMKGIGIGVVVSILVISYRWQKNAKKAYHENYLKQWESDNAAN